MEPMPTMHTLLLAVDGAIWVLIDDDDDVAVVMVSLSAQQRLAERARANSFKMDSFLNDNLSNYQRDRADSRVRMDAGLL
jgi:hypothetical protein